MHATLPLLEPNDFPALRRNKLQTLQVNLGYLCNQQCQHCHVNAGPRRKEIMDLDTIESIIEFLKKGRVTTLDLTGGAPEMNPHFRHLVTTARQLGLHIIDRCNLTILDEPDQTDLAEFLTDNKVEVVASLPCYIEDNVNKQRGKDVFIKSIHGLIKLNKLGYAQPGSNLILNLMYNPQGATLPPAQDTLESDYRSHLKNEHNVTFNRLFTLSNMPINRFGSMLVSTGKFEPYMELLRKSFQAENLNNLMCRSLISVDWQGYIYDCDFNQMLNLPLQINGHNKLKISDIDSDTLAANPIMVKNHCYACAAGQGSSCTGALDSSPEKTG